MTEDPEDTINELLVNFAGEPRLPELVDQVKSTNRQEVLERLGSLLNLSFDRGNRPRTKAQVQQRWFTICAYIAQVMARVVRDLEYEKLRADVEDLKKKVLSRDVHTTRRVRFSHRS